ncbi:MAG: Ig-like domain-containing protein [Anaerolineales bacterium]
MDGFKKLLGQLGVLLLLGLLLSGCSLPSLEQTPTEVSAVDVLPASFVGPLPPALVETTPMPGSRIAAAGELTFYFNQPMDKSSVESALQGTPALNGTFRWADEATLVFSPAQPWPQNADLSIRLAASARSSNGQNMKEAVALSYTSADYLRLTQSLPEGETTGVNPEAAIVASFNQPVVALGPDTTDRPAGFSLEPAAGGRGEWLNTSTYIFYPEPALSGGQTYQVTVNPDLESTDGTPLASVDEWSFTTLQPGFVGVSPDQGALHVRLDAPVVVQFNQAMDRDSVEQAFTLVDEEGKAVNGVFSWSEDMSEMTFTPKAHYSRGMRYAYSLPVGVLARGGTPLAEGLNRSFYAAMDPFVISTVPEIGGIKETYQSVEIQFNTPLKVDDPLSFIEIVPEIKLRAEVVENSILLIGNFVAEQQYTVTVANGITDIWGGVSTYGYSFGFTTAPR